MSKRRDLLSALDKAWQGNTFLAYFRQESPLGRFYRYGLAVAAVAAAVGLRQILEAWIGPGLPTYITFYPAVMTVGLIAGFGPGLLVTILTLLSVAYWVLPPEGFSVGSPVERLGLVIFTFLGLYMSVIAALLRRANSNLESTVAERTYALSEANEELQAQTDELIASFDELRDANDKLQEQEERLRFHMENSPMAVIEWDKDFIVTRWSGESQNMFGWSATETVGNPISKLKLVYEEDMPIVARSMAQLTDGVTRQVVSTNRNYTKNGSVRYCTWYNSVLSDKQGRMASVLSEVIDITEQKEAEQAILLAKEEWERTFDSVPDLIAIMDSQHRITRVNKAMAERLGTTQHQCIGQFCYLSVHGTDQPPASCPHAMTLSDSLQHNAELYEERLGGTFHVTTTPLLNELGEMSGSIHVARDITERKETEDVLRFLNQCGSSGSGESFFEELALFLAKALKMDFICIDVLEDDHLSAQTLAVFHNGEFEDNVSYALKDTPCGDVVGKNICCFPQNVCGLFPNDEVLQDLQAESYLGTTLWSTEGKPIGLIAVIGRQPLPDTRRAESILQLVAARAASELESQQSRKALSESEFFFKESQRVAAIGSYKTDFNSGRWESSEILDNIFGIDGNYPHNLQGWLGLIHPDDREMMDQYLREEVIAQGKPFSKEYRIIRNNDGETRWLLGIGNVGHDINGSIISLIGTIQDITERKQTEELIQRQVEELRATNEDLEQFNDAAVGRELRMIELKREINELCSKAGLPERYKMGFTEDQQ